MCQDQGLGMSGHTVRDMISGLGDNGQGEWGQVLGQQDNRDADQGRAWRTSTPSHSIPASALWVPDSFPSLWSSGLGCWPHSSQMLRLEVRPFASGLPKLEMFPSRWCWGQAFCHSQRCSWPPWHSGPRTAISLAGHGSGHDLRCREAEAQR